MVRSTNIPMSAANRNLFYYFLLKLFKDGGSFRFFCFFTKKGLCHRLLFATFYFMLNSSAFSTDRNLACIICLPCFFFLFHFVCLLFLHLCSNSSEKLIYLSAIIIDNDTFVCFIKKTSTCIVLILLGLTLFLLCITL